MNIQITMKDGTVRKFLHKGRPGGSFTKNIRYEGAFVIIKDEWGWEMGIPAADIEEIKTWPWR